MLAVPQDRVTPGLGYFGIEPSSGRRPSGQRYTDTLLAKKVGDLEPEAHANIGTPGLR
jgi:hypothetical protein